MRHFLTPERYLQINELFALGISKKEIAKTMGCAPSTICDVINNPQRKSSMEKRYYFPKKPAELREYEEMDLSCLPDNVLFQHSKDGTI